MTSNENLSRHDSSKITHLYWCGIPCVPTNPWHITQISNATQESGKYEVYLRNVKFDVEFRRTHLRCCWARLLIDAYVNKLKNLISDKWEDNCHPSFGEEKIDHYMPLSSEKEEESNFNLKAKQINEEKSDFSEQNVNVNKVYEILNILADEAAAQSERLPPSSEFRCITFANCLPPVLRCTKTSISRKHNCNKRDKSEIKYLLKGSIVLRTRRTQNELDKANMLRKLKYTEDDKVFIAETNLFLEEEEQELARTRGANSSLDSSWEEPAKNKYCREYQKDSCEREIFPLFVAITPTEKSAPYINVNVEETYVSKSFSKQGILSKKAILLKLQTVKKICSEQKSNDLEIINNWEGIYSEFRFQVIPEPPSVIASKEDNLIVKNQKCVQEVKMMERGKMNNDNKNNWNVKNNIEAIQELEPIELGFLVYAANSMERNKRRAIEYLTSHTKSNDEERSELLLYGVGTSSLAGKEIYDNRQHCSQIEKQRKLEELLIEQTNDTYCNDNQQQEEKMELQRNAHNDYKKEWRQQTTSSKKNSKSKRTKVADKNVLLKEKNKGENEETNLLHLIAKV